MSADFTAEKMKLTGSETVGAVRAKLEYNNLETVCDCENFDHPVSDTESMSSGLGEKKHNKHMQWRFANAKADAALVVQRAAAQLLWANKELGRNPTSRSRIQRRVLMRLTHLHL
ncbi:hypothetical protein L1987_62479 [Smallanthus sonchifolius]|uniref:Uncharacterized protein n=1 Tax=Smallanthus sonchifolius TaxID=185202 RepID=A0ACB9CAJ4_9ASTR|nr:hypothetical protein L1987_62479 [Smallanthus sonchifolius]